MNELNMLARLLLAAPEGHGTIAGGKRVGERRPWCAFPRPSGAHGPLRNGPGAALAESLAPGYFPASLRDERTVRGTERRSLFPSVPPGRAAPRNSESEVRLVEDRYSQRQKWNRVGARGLPPCRP